MLTTEKSYESDNRTGVNQEGPRANTPVHRLTATSIIGDSVESPNGDDLGTINNLMINLQTGQIEYVVVEFGGVLGIGEKLFAIPFSEFSINADKEVFVLDRDEEYLKNSPGFDKDHWPATNDHDVYLENVSEYYQVATPGFEI